MKSRTAVDRRLGHARRVGPHVGDETDRCPPRRRPCLHIDPARCAWCAREEKPSFLAASCCRVLVVNGAAGFFFRFALLHLGDDERQGPRPRRPPLWHRPRVRARGLCPATLASAASKVWPFLAQSASMVQYSCGLNARISRSRSTMSRRATVWTRPADRPVLMLATAWDSPCIRPAGRECGAPAGHRPFGRRSCPACAAPPGWHPW